MQKSRREFLQTLLTASALVPLSACSTLDRWVMGESRDEGDKVLILGSGLAGLAAAYQLKKHQIPFRLFEASGRSGGRVQTVRDVNISHRHGELGPQMVDADHSTLISLAAELKVSLLEVNPRESLAWFEKGKFLPAKEWKKEASDLQKLFRNVQNEAYGKLTQFLTAVNKDQFPKAVLMDQMSAAELLKRLQTQLRPWMKPFLEQVIRSEWGVEASEISSLHLLHWVRDSFRPSGKKYYKISGGTSVLAQALYDRIGGVIPERFVKFHHQLFEIKKTEKGWTLLFKTPEGTLEIKGRKIICTLPPAILQNIEGLSMIPFEEDFKKRVSGQSLGSHGKVLLGFQDRFWQQDPVLGSGGVWYTDMASSSITEGGDPVVSGLNTLHGILEIQTGGAEGAQTGLHSVRQALSDLNKIDPKSSSYENIHYVQNWKMFPWSKGSRAYLKPGQFQLFRPESIFDGWAFAGDWHSLPWLGTMNGAVQTGFEAANRFVKGLTEK